MVRKVTAFYAWQSDTPEQFNRHFIRIALEEAAKRITENPIIDAEVTIDYDTEGVPGTPPVTQTILNKIVACDIFIPDVSFVARTDAGKFVPNPNVMAEYGYALCAKSHAAMMPVMNEAFGPAKELPFDMGHLRFPLQYRIEVDATDGLRRAARRTLSQQLEERLRLQIAATQPPPPEPIPFPAAQTKDGPARFREPGEAIGFRDGPGAPAGAAVTLVSGPAMWLRLMPPVDPGRFASHKLATALNGGINLQPLISPALYSLRAEDGRGTCALPTSDARESDSIAFALETGEVWAIDTWALGPQRRQPNELYIVEIEQLLRERLPEYARFLVLLGLQPPFRWIAGVTGVRNRRLQIPSAPGRTALGWPGPECVAENIMSEGTYDMSQSPTNALLPFFREIYNKCGVARPDYLPQ
jgi:hypothetical protein